jgi:hypothetical protein
MEKENNKDSSSSSFLKWLFVGCILIAGWYNRNLIIDNISTPLGVVKFDDKCFHKKIDGNYRLVTNCLESDKSEDKNTLKIEYLLAINHKDCHIYGRGYKSSDSGKNAYGETTGNPNYLPNQIPIKVYGEITGDSLNLTIELETNSSKDDEVIVNLSLKDDKIEDRVKGSYTTKVFNSSGTAKLSLYKDFNKK